MPGVRGVGISVEYTGGTTARTGLLLSNAAVSIQTTERYLGCKQKLRCAVNDRLGIEPDAAA